MQKHERHSDTGAKVLEVFLARQRSMTAAEKIQAVFHHSEMLGNMTEAPERQLHPQAGDREETMLRVYGWYPDSAT